MNNIITIVQNSVLHIAAMADNLSILEHEVVKYYISFDYHCFIILNNAIFIYFLLAGSLHSPKNLQQNENVRFHHDDLSDLENEL